MTATPLKRGWQAHKATNLALARAYVKQYAGYLTATLYGLVPTPIEGLSSMAGGPMAVTERLVLYYEPAWVNSVSVLTLATGLAHECFHDQLRHVKRGKAYPDPARFNRAADLFLNGTMVQQTKQVRVQDAKGKQTHGVATAPMWEFPEWALMPEQFGFKAGLTADEYYKLLEEYEKKHPQNAPQKVQGQGDPTSGSSGSTGDGDDPNGQPQPGQSGKSPDNGNGHSHDGSNQIMSGCCGGVAGNSAQHELENTKDQEVGRSEADCRNIAKETARAIKKAIEAQQGRGDMPANWSELVDISDTVFTVPWRSRLANVARDYIGHIRSGGMDYSMRRLSKRSYLRGINLPGLIAYDPILFFIIDSSGSMGTKELSESKRVIADVMVQTGIQKVWYMEADARNQRTPIQLTARGLRDVPILGRGGTDFRPAIRYVEEFIPRPHITIYVTDGYGPAPEKAPLRMKFIWCIVPSAEHSQPATWGETIFLNDALAAA